MSIETCCKCSHRIDTDLEECYGADDQPYCESCRERMEELADQELLAAERKGDAMRDEARAK